MTMQTAYQAYSNNKVLTASPGELTLMLYEGAIKFCNIAVIAIEQQNLNKAHTNIVKAERIISELRATLNPKYKVWEDFERVYEYINRRLIEANIKKDKDIIEEVLSHLRGMRDTWKEVMRLAPK